MLLELALAGILIQGAAMPGAISTIGPTRGHLSADDLTQFGRLANEAGGEVWLVDAHPPEFGKSKAWYATVYLRADSESHDVRRGRWFLAHATLEDFNAFARAKTWTSQVGGTYAQAPAVGTEANHIADSRDLNRPFPVVAARGIDPPSISNESIAHIVSLVRSSPAIESPRHADHPLARISQTRVEGTWPISRLAVVDDVTVTVVNLYPGERAGQSITLRHDGRSWRLESIGVFIG